MKKKIMVISLFTFAAITLMAIGCSKDYGSDIASVNTKVDNLDKRVGTLETLVKDIDAQVKGGSVITSVEPTKNGITVKLSNGKSYTITNGKDGVNGKDGKDGVNGKDGKNGVNGKDGKDGVDGKDGKNGVDGKDGKDGVDGKDGKNGVDGKDGKNGVDGKDGKDGSVVKIGENGNWFIDGRDTGLPSRGKDGAKGDKGEQGAPGKDGKDGAKGDKGDQGAPGKDGKDGAKGNKGDQGAPGKDGVWYEPGTEGAEKGFWVEVSTDAEGKKVRNVTTIKWLPEGTITAIFKDGAVTFFNVAGAHEGVKIGLVPITSLVIIPDAVANGGSLPVVDFGNIVYRDGCTGGTPTAESYLRFRVSPSNVNLASIDAEHVSFYFNTPVLRAEKKFVESVTNVELKDGVLTVYFKVNKSMAASAAEGKDNQVQLRVPFAKEINEGTEVHSDWARVAFTDHVLDLGRIAHEGIGEVKDDLIKLYTSLEDAKGGVSYPIFYNKATNLLDIVRTLENRKLFTDNSKYGLTYVFDLLDKNGKTFKFEEGVNKTDQQEFITLKDGVVTARVFGQNGNQASIDKTPIVRVRLVNGTCVANMGFIKLQFTKEEIPVVKPEIQPVVIDLLEKEASCDVISSGMTVKQMNEDLYHHANLSKNDFHKKFQIRAKVFATSPYTKDGKSYIVNTSKETVASSLFKWDYKEGTETEPVRFYVSPQMQAKYAGQTIRAVAEIFDATTNFVHYEVIFDIKIGVEKVYVQRFTNMWNGNRGMINTEIPAKGNTNSIMPNLNSLFKLKENTSSLTLRYKDGKVITDPSYTYEYEFDTEYYNTNRTVKGTDGKTYTFDVDKDKKILFAKLGDKREKIATLEKFPGDLGDYLKYEKGSEFAKRILNTEPESVVIGLVIKTTKCNGDTPTAITSLNEGLERGKFQVVVRRPLNMTANAKDYFIDGLDKGEKHTFFNVADIVELTDWRNIAFTKETVSREGVNYYDYYKIGTFRIDDTKITYQDKEGGKKYPLQTTMNVEYKDGKLSYTNNGAALMESIYLNVPVIIPHQWGELHGTFTIEVKPTSEAIKK